MIPAAHTVGQEFGLPAGTRLFVERTMAEPLAAACVTEEERRRAASFGSDRRRCEFLTWRAIVRRELGAGVRIGYDAAGAPVVDREVHIGVTHCTGWVAVCISARRCAVDMEPESRNFLRAAPHYLAPEERALSENPLLPAVVWCAKETLYKYAGTPGLDLLRDLRILRIDFTEGTVEGSIRNGRPLHMMFRRMDGCLLVLLQTAEKE